MKYNKHALGLGLLAGVFVYSMTITLMIAFWNGFKESYDVKNGGFAVVGLSALALYLIYVKEDKEDEDDEDGKPNN